MRILVDVDSIDTLDNYIIRVQRYAKMKTDRAFQRFIQNKVLETVREQTDLRLVGGTTNDEYIEEYKTRHKIQEFKEGFVLYNDTILPPILSTKNTKNQNIDDGIVRNYDNGFSIALAFEYGTGIVGEENPVQGAWAYNVNNYGDYGWYYKTMDGTSERTRGYQGFEIYRHTAEEVKKRLSSWVNEYFERRNW